MDDQVSILLMSRFSLAPIFFDPELFAGSSE